MVKKQKLRIGFVLDDGLDKPDGVQQYILSLGSWLRQKGHQVNYIVGETKTNKVEGAYALSKNVRVSSNGNSMTIPLPTSPKLIKDHLSKHKYDIIHVQTPYSPFMGARVIKEANENTAVIGTFHILPNSKIFFFGNLLLGFYLRRSLKRFDQMLSVSPAAQLFARQTFRVDSDVLPNVVDCARFADAKPLDEYPKDVITILFLGRLVPRKGCLVLLKAIKELIQTTDLPEFRVLVCGTGPQLQMLQDYVETNHMSKKVHFLGFIDESAKPNYYATADIAVFPSSGGESFGIVLIEAMARGNAAILAGNNPGYRSVLDDNQEMLFDPLDHSVLAKKLKELLLNSDKRRSLANWGAGHTEQYDINVVGPKLIAIYEDKIAKKTKSIDN